MTPIGKLCLCTAALAVAVAAGNQFTKGGQTAYFHEFSDSERLDGGFFHTYPNWNDARCRSPWGTHKVSIFVPRDYDSSSKRYPVLYTQDGDTTFYKGGAAGKSWWLAQTISNLKRGNRIQEFLTVAVYPVNRNQEYTNEQFAPLQDCCRVDEYAQYLGCLKNWVDDTYRTIPDANNTAIIGSSHGGLASFYIANTNPKTFGKAACLSSSFWAGYKPIAMPPVTFSLSQSALIRQTRATLQSPYLRPRLYLDYGLSSDPAFHNSVIEAKAADTTKEMVTLLKTAYNYRAWETSMQGLNIPSNADVKNYELFVVSDRDGQHTEDSWANRVWIALIFMFPKA